MSQRKSAPTKNFAPRWKPSAARRRSSVSPGRWGRIHPAKLLRTNWTCRLSPPAEFQPLRAQPRVFLCRAEMAGFQTSRFGRRELAKTLQFLRQRADAELV